MFQHVIQSCKTSCPRQRSFELRSIGSALDKMRLAVAECSRQYIAMTELLNEGRSELSVLTTALEKVALSAVTSPVELASVPVGTEMHQVIPPTIANDPVAPSAFDVMRIATVAPEQFQLEAKIAALIHRASLQVESGQVTAP